MTTRVYTLLAAGLSSQMALAAPGDNELPTGGKVVAGQAAISQTGATLTINQGSARTAIDWRSFNVGRQGQVNFVQPDANSVALNRITGDSASQIFGRINANGQVFLSNPNGVYFAPSASVNVGGLVATTHRISLDDFMAGKARFERDGSAGSVINQGELKAALGGYIALLAPEVRNEGLILASMGTVALAAGEVAELQFDGGNTLASLRVTPSTIKALVDNRSAVLAPGGLIILSAHAMDRVQGGVVQNSGRIEATGFSERGGRILLSASTRIDNSGSIAANASGDGPAGTVSLQAPEVVNSGSIEARSDVAQTAGGSVLIDAGRISQASNARIDVSGPAQGGEVRILASGAVELAGRVDASSAADESRGGSIDVQAAQITLSDAQLDTSGAQGGRIVLDAKAAASMSSPVSPASPPSPTHSPAPDPNKVILNGSTQLTSRGRRGSGGTLTLLGDSIDLNNTSSLDASGSTGGGEVLAGGGWQGSGGWRQATTVTMAKGARIDVSAIEQGNGGTAVLWSDVTRADSLTRVAGLISANGGALGGNGGRVETSGAHLKIADTTRVSTLAPRGANGHWLLDPTDLTIAATGGDISGATLSANLGAGNVGLQSTNGASGVNGDINVNDAVSWSANNTLTLTAQRNIYINANIASSGASGRLVLQYAQASATAVASNDFFVANGVTVSLAAGANFSTRNGSATATTNYTVITALGAQGSSTSADLQGMRGTLTGSYALGADIDASATSGWNSGLGFLPVGGTSTTTTASTTFSGNFEGLGHTINALTINRPAAVDAGYYVGLFGSFSNGRLRNVKLTNESVNGASFVGGLVGAFIGTGEFHNNSVSGNVTGGASVGGTSIGGLIGQLTGATTMNFSDTSNIYAGTVTGTLSVGGLVGLQSGSTINIDNNLSTTTSGAVVSNASGDSIGGLLGRHSGGTLNVNHSRAGNVTGVSTATYVGGLVGRSSSTSSFTNNQSSLSITGGGSSVGGLVGQLSGTTTFTGNSSAISFGGTTSVGGLIGMLTGLSSVSFTDTSNTYTGTVTGTFFVGGLLGYHTGGTVSIDNNLSTTTSGSVVSTAAGDSIGGLIGRQTAGTLTINNSRAGNVTGTATSNYVGGLAGRSTGPSTFTNNQGSLSLTGGGSSVGGLVGYLAGTTTFTGNSVALAVGGTTGIGGVVGTVSGTTSVTFTDTSNTYTGTVTGTYYVGGLVGSLTAGTVNIDNNLSTTTSGSVVSNPSGDSIGGLLGRQSGGTLNITNSSAGSITGTATSSYVGGLAGWMTTGAVLHSRYDGNLSGASYIGGLAGQMSGVMTLTESYATGNMSGTGSYVGGLLGSASGGGSIVRSYASGAVSGVTNIGGLIGANQDAVTSSYARGAVTGTSSVGALIGNNVAGASIATSFFDSTVSPIAGIGAGVTAGMAATGMSTANMQTRANFTSATAANGNVNPGWDISSASSHAWTNYDSHNAPLLQHFMTPLTVTANDATVTYSAANYSCTSLATCFAYTPGSPDTSNLFGTVPAYSGTRNVGSYTITPSGLWSNQNGYILSYASGTLTVSAATLTLTAATDSKVYDRTTTSAGTPTVTSGLISGDTVTGLMQAYASRNVLGSNGSTLSITGYTVNDGNSGANYSVVTNTAAGTITPVTLTLGAATDSKVYDRTTTSSGTPTVTGGLISGDTVTGLIQSYASRNVLGTNGSTLSITGYTINDGNSGANYSVVANTAAGTITPAGLTLAAATDSKVYDRTTTSAGTPTVTSGLIAGDTVTGLTQSYASRNVLGANASTLSITGYTVNDGNSGANYSVVANTAVGTITAASLTLGAATDSKVYDRTTTSTGTPTVTSGLISGDTVTGLTQSYASRNVLGSNGSTLSITGYTVNDGNSGANYSVLTNTAAGTITAASLTLGAATDSKVYDRTTTSTGTPTVTSGLISGDTVTGLTQSYASRNVLGTNGSTLSITGYTVNDGNSGANYSVVANTAVGTITPATLTLGAATDSKVYDRTTTSTGTPTVTSGLIAGDTVTGLTQSYASRNVLGANASTLSITGYTVNDGNSGANYSVLANTAVGTITPATLTLGAATDSKVYDRTTTSAGTPTVTSGLIAGDTVTGLTQSYASRNVLGANASTLSITGYTVNDGNSGANYSVLTNTAVGTITAASLTLGAATDSKVYDGGTTSAGAPTVTSGLIGGDTVTGLSQSYLSKNVLGANGSTLSVTGYTVNDGNSGANYSVLTNTAVGTITAASLTLGAATDSKVYDRTTASAAAPTVTSGLIGGDTVTGLTQSYASRNVLGSNGSTLSITGYTVNDGNSGANYSVLTNTAVGTITPASLTLTAATDSKVYDRTTTSTGTPTVTSGLISGDTVTGLSQSYASRNVLGTNGSTLSITGYTVNDGNSGANYSVLTNTALGTITPASLTLTAATDSKVYDRTTTSTGTPTVTSGLISGDTVTGLTQSYASRNVLGTNGSTLSITSYTVNDGNSGANYSVLANSAAGTITPASLTLGAATVTKVYDGGTTSAGVPTVASGLISGDTVTGLSQSYLDKNVLGTNGSTLSITGYTVNDGNSGANYSVLTNTALGTITPASLTLTAATDSKVYDRTTTSAGTPTATSGLLGGDTVTGLSQSYLSRNVLGSNGSTLSITGYTVNDGNGGANYSVVTNTAAGTITPVGLTLGAATDSKVYDGTTTSAAAPAVTSGLISGDTVTGLTQSYASRNVLGTNGSTLSITSYTVNDGNGGANYSVLANTAAGTITPASLTLGAVTATKVYDGGTTSAGAPTVASGLISGDTVTGLSQSYLDKNVLGTNGSTLSVTGYTVNDGNGGANYSVLTNTAVGTITPASLTLSAATGTKVYDGTTASAGTPTVASGLIGGDTVTALSQSYLDKNVLGSNGSTLSVTGYTVNDGNGGANYSVLTNTAAGTITPASLTLSAASDTKVYDGTLASAGAPTVISGLIGGDTVTGLTQTYQSRNVLGTNGSTLSITGYTVNDGNGGANYSVLASTAAGTITPASLTISAVTDTKAYDGTTASTAVPSVTGGLVGGDTVTGLTQRFLSQAALGTNNSTLAVDSGHAINDGNGGANYAVTTHTAAGTILPGNPAQDVVLPLVLPPSPPSLPALPLQAAIHVPLEMPIPLEFIEAPAAGNAPRRPAEPVVLVNESMSLAELKSAPWVTVEVTQATLSSGFSFVLPSRVLRELPSGAAISATLADGRPLPRWLRFIAKQNLFVAHSAPPGALPLQVQLRHARWRVVLEIKRSTQGIDASAGLDQ